VSAIDSIHFFKASMLCNSALSVLNSQV